MRAQIDPLVAKKMGLDDIKKAVNFEKEMERFAGNDAFVRRLFNNFFIQPMIENCYHEAKGDAIVQE